MSTGMQLVVAVSLLAAAAASGPARRGMYVSLYREQPHQPHVFEYILGDAAKEDHLLAYCRRHGVNALTIYDGYPAMRQHAANLSAFVARARAVAGITTVEVAMSERTSFWDVLNAYQRNQPTVDAATGRLDGIVTEIVYWHDGDANDAGDAAGRRRVRPRAWHPRPRAGPGGQFHWELHGRLWRRGRHRRPRRPPATAAQRRNHHV